MSERTPGPDHYGESPLRKAYEAFKIGEFIEQFLREGMTRSWNSEPVQEAIRREQRPPENGK